MDIREFKKVKVVNTAQGRIVSSAFSIGHDEELIMETNRYPDIVLDDLNLFYSRGQVDFVPLNDEPKKELIEKHTETVVSETGIEHTVFKPNQDKLINVEEIDTSGKAVNIGFSKMDAIDLLGKHWKSLEKEVVSTTDVSKLNLLLSVAREQEVTGKKLEIIKNRIGELV